MALSSVLPHRALLINAPCRPFCASVDLLVAAVLVLEIAAGVEDDIGLSKADQLATRLRSIADGLEVVAEPSSVLDVLADGYSPSTDILIDATINVTVAARLDEWARAATTRPLIAQVAADPRSATLGMLIVVSPDDDVGPATIDDATWTSIHDDSVLERFTASGPPLAKTDQLVPALGCSTPTFHGSAADLACLAGTLVSLLASHIGVTATGTHLIESSHAHGPAGGGHHFIAYRAAVLARVPDAMGRADQ